MHTTENLPRLTIDGERSIKLSRNIDIVESYILRTMNGGRLTLDQIADRKVQDVMECNFGIRREVVKKKVDDDPYAADGTARWRAWTLLKILQA